MTTIVLGKKRATGNRDSRMRKRILGLTAICVALQVHATWILNGNTATDGEFTFKVQGSSTGVVGEYTMFSVTKATDTPCELDLTTFESDTGTKIVETMALANSMQNGLGNILSVTGFIGPDVTIIGPSFFCNQTAGNTSPLKRIHVSENLKSIGENAMRHLHQMDDFFPTDMKALTFCGTSAFNQTSLKGDISMPELESLPGNFCFIVNGTAAITSVYAPKVKSIGTRAFSGQSVLTNVIISTEATLISERAFESCRQLESFAPRKLPKLTECGVCSFFGCSSLSGNFDFPCCTKIGNNAFQDCILLERMTVSPNMTSIGMFAFWNCAKLSSFGPTTLSGFTGTVGDYAFADCPLLTGDFDLGGATAIGAYAFSKYQKSSQGSLITSIRATNVQSIAGSAFQQCGSLTNAVFSQSLKSIGGSAFGKCVALEHFTPFLPSDMTLLGSYAFQNCVKLTDSLTLDSPDLSVGGMCFHGCSSLSNVTINGYFRNFPGTMFNNTRDGLCFYWNVAAPETITQPVAGGPNGFRFYIKAGKNDPGWKAWATDETFGKPFSKSTYGYPGRKTFGLLQDTAYASAVPMWLIDNRNPGLAVIVR